MLSTDIQREPLELRGDSSAIRAVRAQVTRAAAERGPVLILAAPGLDGDAVARAIHEAGRSGPFVRVDCRETTGPAAERILFGRAGDGPAGLEVVDEGSAFASAQGGTLLLHAVGELAASAQSRLATLLRDGEMLANGAAVHCDCRIVAVADPSIDQDVEAGRVRPDLYRRLRGTTLAIPPLCDRPDDVRVIAAEVTAALSSETGGAAKQLTPPALTLLAALPWRENVRELCDLLGRVVPISAGAVVRLEDVLACLPFEGRAPIGPPGSLREARRRFEREYIAAVLRHHGGRVPDAAAVLGIQRTNLYRKARQLGLDVSRRSDHS